MPQLGLQHSVPDLQMTEPHCLSDGMDGQICCVHIMPGLTQRLHDALQQVIPSWQTVLPHLMPLIGTHWALPSITSQVVLLVHLTVAHGVMVSPEARSIGLAPTPEARTAMSRALSDRVKIAMLTV
jgi:hypothetical protein